MKEIKGTAFSTMTLEEVNSELDQGVFAITVDSERIGTIFRNADEPDKGMITMNFAKFRRSNKKDLKRKKCKIIRVVSGKGMQSLDKMDVAFYLVK